MKPLKLYLQQHHLQEPSFRKLLRRLSSRGLAAFLLLSVIIAQTGCGAGKETGAAGAAAAADPVSRESFYFDTICRITIYAMDADSDASDQKRSVSDSQSTASGSQSATSDSQSATSDSQSSAVDSQDGTSGDTFTKAAQAAIEEAFSLCSEYELLLSKTMEGSDIWNINHAGGEPVSCDARTRELIQKGIAYGDLSGGLFDITIGPAEDLWDFHSDNPKVPDAKALAEAVSHVDYQNIAVDASAGTVQLTDPEAEIDLGGIAKGYIADAVCKNLRQNNVTSAIVSLGGNIECIGEKAEGTPFSIGIETPYSDRTEIAGAAQLSNGTLVTSGVYERYFAVDGKEYHHILSPETGYPVDSDVLGVTIRGKEGTSADCDALSTTCLMLGAEKGMALMEGLDGYEAFFILRDGTTMQTDGMYADVFN